LRAKRKQYEKGSVLEKHNSRTTHACNLSLQILALDKPELW